MYDSDRLPSAYLSGSESTRGHFNNLHLDDAASAGYSTDYGGSHPTGVPQSAPGSSHGHRYPGQQEYPPSAGPYSQTSTPQPANVYGSDSYRSFPPPPPPNYGVGVVNPSPAGQYSYPQQPYDSGQYIPQLQQQHTNLQIPPQPQPPPPSHPQQNRTLPIRHPHQALQEHDSGGEWNDHAHYGASIG